MIYHKSKQILLKALPQILLDKFEIYFRHFFALFFRGNNAYCPICEMNFKKFIPLNYQAVDTNYLCPRCGSAQRQRLLWLYLSARCLILSDHPVLLHLSPRSCLVHKLRSIRNLTYVTSDYEKKTMDRQFDLRNIQEQNDTYDIIVCYHIMEHIQEDIKAMREIYRILKPGGVALFQVPFWDKDTFENPEIRTSEDRRVAFGQGDHVRIYGYDDFTLRLSKSGFTVTPVRYAGQLGPQICRKYVLNEDEIIFACHKP